ncbi:hypothetical protein GE21DRAFT_356 [Neurospora crassa]|uniref:Uncharacterized protein n=1 Tax=Neurospora crassa (strain ATCC 24698 / 74-OR23-1A / CBS 708.71 / DSM 1257 / FGSC 987) TaxID=367110 RepID=A7UVZ6_NEUCR|nr:hypothetical protein NCU11210 [Neurospora crassa OR74A]EDO65468.1 hypothetical protein NCU11210 [Neurospora crassa OR74A]KHE89069.1 hypothetical protein GE21DRAFT_356 [Neurospora crassa]|eukprot:XP_001728559.1 hypothetical protein NCU11210 [Neurospora crassa OR74A]
MPEQVSQKWAGLHGMTVELDKLGKHAHMRVLDARNPSPLVAFWQCTENRHGGAQDRAKHTIKLRVRILQRVKAPYFRKLKLVTQLADQY